MSARANYYHASIKCIQLKMIARDHVYAEVTWRVNNMPQKQHHFSALLLSFDIHCDLGVNSQ